MYLKLFLPVIFIATFALSNLRGQEKDHSRDGKELAGFEFEFPAMGTLVQITVYCADQERAQVAAEQAQKTVLRLAAILTDYDPESETRRLSTLAFHSPTTVSEPLWTMLTEAERWHTISGGAFDCSLGMLTQTWRKYRRAGRIPEPSTIQDAKTHSGWDKIKLDPNSKTVQFSDQQLRLDFGAIGKGYIADQAFEVFKSHSMDCCLVNISGNMRCGTAPPGKPGWLIAISPLERDGKPIRKIAVTNQALATSGDLWQYTVVDGVKRSHILDPKTGYGVAGPLANTAIAPTASDADALATIGCLLPWEAYARLLSTQKGTAALRASNFDELKIVHTQDFPDPLP